ncbi:TetR/AcrR family transcriptional regulator [Acetivibrio straminisolvens]|uniref:Transcriptional regulator n=1 Tax=Acetivibrio straminisolvens JCM 21531 TaxID=1294263 RepID=W4V0D8_9FIRM|nr:TetR/AcrR family transcriptional regulator [Acetivibrio straminisolvens]GAE86696.1 transcriptional regulator [Acetivibrio straminisolvens JCM 21531]
MNTSSRREREKKARESEILAKAEELFLSKGFDNTSMDDLAKESQYTKRTIYKYFTSKEDLFYAVILRGYERLLAMIDSECSTGKTGFEKVKLACQAYYKFFCKFPELHSLMSLWTTVKAKGNGSDSPFRQKFMNFNQTMFQRLMSLFEDGKADGSICSDYDISELSYSSIFLITSFFHMFSHVGNTYTQNFNLDKERFVSFTINLLTDSFNGHK